MIIAFYGTTGELIKIAPILKSVDKDHLLAINTSQQPNLLRQLIGETGIRDPDFTVANGYKGTELAKTWHMALWLPRVLTNLVINNHRIRQLAKSDGSKPLVVVHGDTVTTVLGAVWGRMNGYTVAHIEAGLRSHDWKNPFPEEIDRMIVSKLARVHYSPGDVPVANLKKAHAKGQIVNTKLNTVLDSILMAREIPASLSEYSLPKKYGVVSIHRNELMARPDVLKQLLITLNEHAKHSPLIFLDHSVTKARITELGYDDLFTAKNFIRLPKLSYYKFMSLLAGAQYAVTDSGGLQEESAYLNMPCLLHRLATERDEGLGANVVLSKFDDKIVRDFLKNPLQHKGRAADKKLSPTKVILESWRKLKFLP